MSGEIPELFEGKIVSAEKEYKIISDLDNIDTSITEIDKKVNQILNHLGLPTKNVVVDVPERIVMYKNLEDVIDKIASDKTTMLYLSKFVHAITDGLFDAALNYLWDATINELRKRISNYDVEYFYDVVISEPKKRGNLSGEKDLVNIQDSDLLVGVKKIELINDVAYNELDHIKYMRNWTSTAHPNEEELTGLKLLGWLEICIKNVFNLPLSDINIEIKKLLSDIKTRRFDKNEIALKKTFLLDLNSNQSNSLLNGLFGIYVSDSVSPEAIDNINEISPQLWSLADDSTKNNIGIKYGNFLINGHTDKQQSAKSFLEVVSGQSVIPDDLKSVEIANILSDLSTANKENNNFYSEPSIARELNRYVKNSKSIPEKIEKDFVITVISCFLTNGNGVAWNAEDFYVEMISNFTKNQALIGLLSYLDDSIQSKLNNSSLSDSKYTELLNMLKVKITTPKAVELINFIISFKGVPKIKFLTDSTYKRQYLDFVNEHKNLVL